MGIFFTWHSSEHGFHLRVKWEPQDEFRGAANTVDWMSGGSLAAAHSCCRSPMHPTSHDQIAFQVSGFRADDRPTVHYSVFGLPGAASGQIAGLAMDVLEDLPLGLLPFAPRTGSGKVVQLQLSIVVQMAVRPPSTASFAP